MKPRMTIEELLRWRVECAQAEAPPAPRAAARDVDVVITDMVMPKVGGAEVIRAARRTAPSLPVICISGYTQESVAKEVESIENLYFLAKPFSLKQLAGTVKTALQKSRVGD